MKTSEHAVWALTLAAACALLLAPALWNGFPLLQWDTGGYLARWFEGSLVSNRSTVYGLFVAAGIPFDFWPVIAVQAALALWIVALVLRNYGGPERPVAFLAVIGVLSTITTLPWIAGALLTDVLAGTSVLGLHLLLFGGSKIGRFERAALVAFIAFSAATHSATFALLLGLLLVAIAFGLFRRDLVPRAHLVRGGASLLLGAVLLLVANVALSGRLAWTPGGYGVLFGRMLQDGIVARYLADRCPDARLKLCAYRAELPRDADAFLWGSGESVFNRLGRFSGLGDEMRTIVLESLVAYPWLQLRAAATGTARQIVKVGSGEGVLPTVWHTYGIMERYTPKVLPAMRAARQQHRELGFEEINSLHAPVALASIGLLPLLAMLGWRRRRFSDLGLLASTVSLAVLGNAAICGVLSVPHDRYGARIVWIATFAVLIAAVRLVREERQAAGLVQARA